MICPKDMKPCCNDLCYGSGCMMAGGAPMLKRCPRCRGIMEDDGNMICEDCWTDEEEDQAFEEREGRDE